MNITSVRNIVAAIVFSSTSFGLAARAQDNVIANAITIPFTFEFGSHSLPGGTYRVAHAANQLIRISNDKGAAVMITTPAVKLMGAERGGMTFDKVGDRYFLRQVWAAGEIYYDALPVSKAEKAARVPPVVASSSPGGDFGVAVIYAAK